MYYDQHVQIYNSYAYYVEMRKGLLQIYIIVVHNCYLMMIFICFKGLFLYAYIIMPVHFLYRWACLCLWNGYLYTDPGTWENAYVC